MAVEVEELYGNLSKLLDDICKFLSDEANYVKLSPQSRSRADALISRSKIQLQEIAKINIDEGAYVDMNRNPVEETDGDDDVNNIYTAVDEDVVPTPPVIQEVENPYANLAAKDVSQNVKYGSLSWRCKIILKFEKMKRIYAGIHNNWLLIYSSEKDCKPLQTFNLKFHRAQYVSKQQGKNISQDFELVCTFGEKKAYYFIALTHKDMLQWISHINRCHDSLNASHEPSISEDESCEVYDKIKELTHKENDDYSSEEETYQEIDLSRFRHEVVKVDKPPDLPARRLTKPNTTLPSVSMAEEEDDDEEFPTYDPVDQPLSSAGSSDSFSDDSDSDIYEPFVSSKPPEIKVQLHNTKGNSTDTSINKTDSFTRQKPQTPVKPKNLVKKTRVFTATRK